MDIDEYALGTLMAWLVELGYRHTTITPLSHAQVNARPGNAWAKTIQGLDISALKKPVVSNQAARKDMPKDQMEFSGPQATLHGLQDIFGWSRPFREQEVPAELFKLMQQARILSEHEAGWRSQLRVSSLNGVLYAHSAFPTTAEDSVFFGPDTYRYVHEITSELATRSQPVNRAADIGSGAGPGGIAMALYHPQAEVWALDINQAALQLTAINAKLASAANLKPVHSNLLSGVTGHFDLITANPPYLVDQDQRAYRHGGGVLGADLSLAIIDAAVPRLAAGGTLLLYTGVAIVDGIDVFKAEAFKRLAASSLYPTLTWSYREIDPDVFGEELLNACYADTDRIAAVVLKVTLAT